MLKILIRSNVSGLMKPKIYDITKLSFKQLSEIGWLKPNPEDVSFSAVSRSGHITVNKGFSKLMSNLVKKMDGKFWFNLC